MQNYMEEAIKEAEKAFAEDEVPIGCVIVHDGKIIAREHNTKIADNNSLFHAEMKALFKAQQILGSKYLYDCEMYVTTEPCAMCAGALINTRMGKLCFALEEPKSGCCGSVYNLLDGKFNHKVEIEKNVLREKALKLMQDFFKNKRSDK